MFGGYLCKEDMQSHGGMAAIFQTKLIKNCKHVCMHSNSKYIYNKLVAYCWFLDIQLDTKTALGIETKRLRLVLLRITLFHLTKKN